MAPVRKLVAALRSSSAPPRCAPSAAPGPLRALSLRLPSRLEELKLAGKFREACCPAQPPVCVLLTPPAVSLQVVDLPANSVVDSIERTMYAAARSIMAGE